MLVDDLITRGVSEPHRMFTSPRRIPPQPAREDNADLRLTETGRALGLVDDERWAAFTKREAIERETARLRATWATHPAKVPERRRQPCSASASSANTAVRPAAPPQRELRRADDPARRPEAPETDPQVVEQLEIAAKYQGYRPPAGRSRPPRRFREHPPARQPRLHHRARPLQGSAGPPQPAQARDHRPGQPHPGHHPAAISLLLVWLKRSELARGTEVEIR